MCFWYCCGYSIVKLIDMKNRKILIVEDDQSIRFLLKHVLEVTYNVTSSKNGFEALTKMQQGYMPDLIISDLSMPEMSGVNFLATLRESAFFKEIPIVVLSASDSSKEKISCLKMGADDYIVKPFNPEELELRVFNILQRTKN